MDSRGVTLTFIICIAVGLIVSSEGCMHAIFWDDGPNLDRYNIWANSTNFTVDTDSIQFFFRFQGNVSAFLVTEEDYRSCNNKNPLLRFSENLAFDIDYIKLNRLGYYYFIGGNDGSCQKGLKMSPLVKERQPGQPVFPPSQDDTLCSALNVTSLS